MAILLSITVFMAFGLIFVLGNLAFGRLIRPQRPHPVKASIYECGEKTIGSAWVQFDLRFYIVALFYLIFDVEVAMSYPLASLFRDFPLPVLLLTAPFVALIVIGYAYEWYSGSLEWVRSEFTSLAARLGPDTPAPAAPPVPPAPAATPAPQPVH